MKLGKKEQNRRGEDGKLQREARREPYSVEKNRREEGYNKPNDDEAKLTVGAAAKTVDLMANELHNERQSQGSKSQANATVKRGERWRVRGCYD